MRASDYPVITTLVGNELIFLTRANTSDLANNVTPNSLGTYLITTFGLILSANNIGTAGVGVFVSPAGSTLQFKNIAPGSSRITVTDDSVNHNIDLDVDESALNIANMGGTLGITHGGTGATTASGALTNLGALPLAGGTMTGVINMGSHQINSVSDPTSDQDAATKIYVDNSLKAFNETAAVSHPIIWSGTATTSSGTAAFYPTVDGTPSGTAIFTNIHSVQATAIYNTITATQYVFTSIQGIDVGNQKVTVNAGTGTTVASGGGASVVNAPDGTTIYLTIFGN